jgi:hypothetical protein
MDLSISASKDKFILNEVHFITSNCAIILPITPTVMQQKAEKLISETQKEN